MNKTVAIIISPNYKDYARKYLAECVGSIRMQDYAGEMKIFITDNESTEESYGYLESVLSEDKIPPPASQARALRAGLTPFPPERLAFSRAGAKGGNYEIIRNKNNDGFAKGNNDCMKLALERGFDYIILFNMDTVLEKDCVRQMVEAAEEDKIPPTLPREYSGHAFVKGGNTIGAVQARLMLYHKENLTPASPFEGEGTINSLGNVTHFLGFGYASGYGEEYVKLPRPDCPKSTVIPAKAGIQKKYLAKIKLFLDPRFHGDDEFPSSRTVWTRNDDEICYPSGAAVLFTKEALEKVGLFDEEFWMYNEDQDLGWRIWLAGYKCVLAAEAVVYHKYEFSRSIKKYYFMDRNRIIAVLKNYHWATLLLIAPAFLAMEIGLLFFSFSNGWFKEKIKVYKYFSSIKNWRYIMAARKQAQSLRRVKDKEIVRLFSGKIWYQEIGDGKLKIANIVFTVYWRIIRGLIRW